MAGRKKRGQPWEDEFEDISSDSHRQQTQGRRASQRRPEEWTIPEWDSRGWNSQDWSSQDWNSQGRNSRSREDRSGYDRDRRERERRERPRDARDRSRRTGPERRPPVRSPQPRKRTDKPVNKGVRRLMIGVTVLVMAASTALLAIFLLFKVSEIRVIGDEIPGCTEEDVLSICGCKVGDNLFFFPAGSKEKELKERLPYIEEAKISRQFPGTLEIELTKAQVASCVSAEGSWLCLSGGGKALEAREQPAEGVMQVTGLPVGGLQVGQGIGTVEEQLQARADELERALTQLQNEASSESEETDKAALEKAEADLQAAKDDCGAFRAYRAVVSKLEELGTAGNFTKLDLTDMSGIRLVYLDRVEFRLGAAVELEYKVGLGISSLEKWASQHPGTEARGVMDLTTADETKTAYFTEGDIGETVPAQPSAQPSGDPAAQPTPTPEPTATPGPRDEGIPDSPFTGDDTGGDDTGGGDTGGGDTDGGDTDGGDTDGDGTWGDDTWGDGTGEDGTGDGGEGDWTDDGWTGGE